MECKVLMLHGYKGVWNNGWFATVQSKLKNLRVSFISPNLPNPEAPEYIKWKNEILKIIDNQFLQPNSNVNIIIVAHSLACFAILRLIDELLLKHKENLNDIQLINKLKCIFLVAPIVSFHSKFPQFTNYNFSLLNKSFSDNNLQISPIKTYLLYSTDDNYVESIDIHNFIKCFSCLNANDSINNGQIQHKETKSSMLKIVYIEKQGYKHFMQDDLPFVTNLIVENCIK